jgi:predicted amidohydrolase YtcJ
MSCDPKSEKSERTSSSDTENWAIGKIDNVKSLRERQVKARRLSFLIGRSLLFLCVLSRASQAAEKADLLLLNGNVYTVNENQPHAEALAIKAGRILFVGANTEAQSRRGAETRVVDLHGQTVLPGLTDSHCHIFGIGAREMTLNLEGTNSSGDFLAKVKTYLSDQPPGSWVRGRGWIETFWTPPKFPTRQELDRIAPQNPIFLTRADGHAAVANSAALKQAGINKETPNPFGGEILKDRETGEPTGMLLDRAQDLVAKHIPQPRPEEREQQLLRGIQREIDLGWCEIQNAGSELEDVAVIRKAYDAGRAKIRMYNACYGPRAAAQELLREGATLNACDHHFTQRTIKVVFDGALGSRGAALLQPYTDAPNTSGYLTEKEAELRPMLEQALRAGLQVETHAIGDRANRLILDLYEEAFKAVPPDQRKIQEPRWRVEHAQILDPADLPRFAKLGVIPSMQPSHAISDLFFAPARLGLQRLSGAYAWQSLLKSGVIIAGGSDAPVERGEPMIEFYAAVARKSLQGFSGEGWHPEQAVTRAQALKMLTLWPAFAAFEETDKGTIEVGKLADFTVLSQDIMKIPETDILKTECVMTIIGGEIVHQK